MNATTTTPSRTEIHDRANKAPRKAHFYVAPRFTGGSPALVDMDTCIRVAGQEADFFEPANEGILGAEFQKNADKLGLAHICYARWEAKGKTWRLDLLTGETFIEPKKLSDTELARVVTLQKQQGLWGLTPAWEAELRDLLARAIVHRQATPA